MKTLWMIIFAILGFTILAHAKEVGVRKAYYYSCEFEKKIDGKESKDYADGFMLRVPAKKQKSAFLSNGRWITAKLTLTPGQAELEVNEPSIGPRMTASQKLKMDVSASKNPPISFKLQRGGVKRHMAQAEQIIYKLNCQ